MRRRNGPGITPQPASDAEIPATESGTNASHPTGCPRGCGSYHELPCLVGEPIPVVADYLDSGVFVLRNGAPALSSLREQVAA
jgi:hypothetical protein